MLRMRFDKMDNYIQFSSTAASDFQPFSRNAARAADDGLSSAEGVVACGDNVVGGD